MSRIHGICDIGMFADQYNTSVLSKSIKLSNIEYRIVTFKWSGRISPVLNSRIYLIVHLISEISDENLELSFMSRRDRHKLRTKLRKIYLKMSETLFGRQSPLKKAGFRHRNLSHGGRDAKSGSEAEQFQHTIR